MRPMRVPVDLDAMGEMATRAFVYPDNPAWSVDVDERQEMAETVRNARRMWPLIRFLQLVTPSMREVFVGLVWEEEEGRPAGVTQYQRMGNHPFWHLNTVAVLPEYRRRGIARRLVEATLEDVRRRGGETVVLGVIDGNYPAYTLYESLGFRHFGGNHELRRDPSVSLSPASIPEGYSLAPIGQGERSELYEAALRITPQIVQEYAPVRRERWQRSGGKGLLMTLMERIQGTKRDVYGIRDARGVVVGWYELQARKAASGINRAHLWLDPEHAVAAPCLVSSVVVESARRSPGLKLQVEIDSCYKALLDAALAAGCVHRLEYHGMGVRL